MLCWLKKSESDKETGPGLPSPASPLHETLNQAVEQEYNASPCSSGKKRKNASTADTVPSKRLKWLNMHGNSKAASHFTKFLGKRVNESSIRGFKASYVLHKEIIHWIN